MIYGKHFIVDNKLINSEEYEIQIPVVKMSHGDWQKKYKLMMHLIRSWLFNMFKPRQMFD